MGRWVQPFGQVVSWGQEEPQRPQWPPPSTCRPPSARVLHQARPSGCPATVQASCWIPKWVKGKTQGRLEVAPGSVDCLVEKIDIILHLDDNIVQNISFICLMVQMSPATRGISSSINIIMVCCKPPPTEEWCLQHQQVTLLLWGASRRATLS